MAASMPGNSRYKLHNPNAPTVYETIEEVGRESGHLGCTQFALKLKPIMMHPNGVKNGQLVMDSGNNGILTTRVVLVPWPCAWRMVGRRVPSRMEYRPEHHGHRVTGGAETSASMRSTRAAPRDTDMTGWGRGSTVEVIRHALMRRLCLLMVHKVIASKATP